MDRCDGLYMWGAFLSMPGLITLSSIAVQ